MIDGVWSWLATPGASVTVGIVGVFFLRSKGHHLDSEGILARRKVAGIFILSAASYSFFVMASSQLFFNGPPISMLIAEGFGDTRTAFLMLGVVFDLIFRIWNELSTRD